MKNLDSSRYRTPRAISKGLALIFVFASCVITAQAVEPGPKVSRMNRIIELMETGQPAIGIFSQNLSPRTAAWIASSKLDFVVIDLEHSPYDPSRLETYLLAMTDKRKILQKSSLQPNVVPIVRVPTAGREQLLFVIKQVLDLGPMGVLVPHVDNAEDARAAVRACRYPQPKGSALFKPEGMRGVGNDWAARQWGLTRTEYTEQADLWPLDPKGEMLLWLMIETRRAVENIEEIVQVPGIGGFFIGPADLSHSLSVQRGDPELESAIQKVLAACRNANVPCGIFDPNVTKRTKQGFQFMAVGVDAGVSKSVNAALMQADELRRK